ncbi:MAG: hypothetical protein ACE5O2_05435 [Armatimonadota bacterium]
MAALISAAILMTGLLLTTQGYYEGAKTLRHAALQTMASGMAEAEMERMRAAVSRGEAVASHEMPRAAMSALPGADGTVEVAPYGSRALQRVTVYVEWDEPHAGRRSLELTSLLPRNARTARGSGLP